MDIINTTMQFLGEKMIYKTNDEGEIIDDSEVEQGNDVEETQESNESDEQDLRKAYELFKKTKLSNRLSETEKSYIYYLIAAGYNDTETSRQAAKKGIQIAPQNVRRMRPKVNDRMVELVGKKEDSALKRGIALKEKRIERLAEVEELLHDNIIERLSKKISVDFYEIREWRAILKDVRDEIEGCVPSPTININQINNFGVLLDRVYKDQEEDINVIDG